MTDLVIGIGEIGGPLADLLELKRSVVRKDTEPLNDVGDVEAMHVCFPFDPSFKNAVIKYVMAYEPDLTVIHSTVLPGTTREIARFTGQNVVYSPVRGRHREMCRDLLRYTKFIAAPDRIAQKAAWEYFDAIGLFRVETIHPPEALELAKLVETTYSALLITWAQELERFCAELGVDREAALSLTEEVDYLPVYIFYPGHIKGHCLIQNLGLLEQIRESPFIDAIRASNDACTEAQKADRHRYRPRRL